MIARHAGRPEFGPLIFHWACVTGNLRAAEKIADTFHIPGNVATACSHNTLRGALAHGHVSVARWLADRYRISAAELESNLPLTREKPHYPPDAKAWIRETLGEK